MNNSIEFKDSGQWSPTASVMFYENISIEVIEQGAFLQCSRKDIDKCHNGNNNHTL